MSEKKERIVRYTLETLPKSDTDWERVKNMTEEEIEANALSDPDNPPLEEDFWKNAILVIPGRKRPVQIRLDPDVLLWFKSQGPRYQTRINAVLRSYMTATESKAEYKTIGDGSKTKKRRAKK